MTEDFLNMVKNCSSHSKLSLNSYFLELLSSDKQESSTQQSEQSNQHFAKLQQIFFKISNKFSIEKSREVSKDERNRKMLTHHEYNYGQITFKTIFQIIKKVKGLKKMSEEQIFYDLGSGSGKVIFGSGLCYGFKKCKGIEYLESLYRQSMTLREKVMQKKQEIEESVNECNTEFEEYSLPHIEMINSDFKAEDWSDGTVIFVSSTCYSREVMDEISSLSERLQKGSILVSLTKSLNNDHWTVVDKFEGETSWGSCMVFLHRKQRQSVKDCD